MHRRYVFIIAVAIAASAPSVSQSLDPVPQRRGTAAGRITSVSVDKTTLHPGETLLLTFTTSGTFDLGNDFIAQLSSPTGSFAGAADLPALEVEEGSLQIRIPCDQGAGAVYRLRLRSTAPADTADVPPSLTIAPAPELTITPDGPLDLCQGGSVVLTAAPGFTTYRWSNGMATQSITVAASGTFQVTAVDAQSCERTSAQITVTVHPPPAPTITQNGNILSAPPGFLSYLWSTGDTSREITIHASGSYTVQVTDVNGCGGTSAPFTAMLAAIAQEQAPMPGVRALPVPAADRVGVEIEGIIGETRISLIDLKGNDVVNRRELLEGARELIDLPLDGLADGVYLLKVESGTGVWTEKIVKR
jgi:hypothetical protein